MQVTNNVIGVVLSPTRTLKRLKEGGRLSSALLIQLAVGLVFGLATFLTTSPSPRQPLWAIRLSPVLLPLLGLLLTVLLGFSYYVSGAILGRRGSFARLLTTVCYCNVVALPVALILVGVSLVLGTVKLLPAVFYVSLWLATPWIFILNVVGIKEHLSVSSRKALGIAGLGLVIFVLSYFPVAVAFAALLHVIVG